MIRRIGRYLRRARAAAVRDRSPTTEAERLRAFFSITHYLSAYPEVAQSGIEAFEHFIQNGDFEGRSPNPFFDGAWYLLRYPDVKAGGKGALAHYVAHGASEGRDPSPRFRTSWYLAQNPDVAESGINPLQHFLHYGSTEGRQPLPAGEELKAGHLSPVVTDYLSRMLPLARVWEPDFNHLRGVRVEELPFERKGASPGAATWSAVYRSLSRAPRALILTPGLDLDPSSRAVVETVQRVFGKRDVLLLATDDEALGTVSPWLNHTEWRSLAEFSSSLDEPARASIVATFVNTLKPCAVVVHRSEAGWEAISRNVIAPNENVKIFAIIGRAAMRSRGVAALLHQLRERHRNLATLYFEAEEDHAAFAHYLGISRDIIPSLQLLNDLHMQLALSNAASVVRSPVVAPE